MYSPTRPRIAPIPPPTAPILTRITPMLACIAPTRPHIAPIHLPTAPMLARIAPTRPPTAPIPARIAPTRPPTAPMLARIAPVLSCTSIKAEGVGKGRFTFFLKHHASIVLSMFWRLFAMRQTVKEMVGRYLVQPL